jgi:hypothetical protein
MRGVRRLILDSKSMVIRMRKFLLLVESEKCDDLPRIQLKAKALRWDLETIFKFPEDVLTAGCSGHKKQCR